MKWYWLAFSLLIVGFSLFRLGQWGGRLQEQQAVPSASAALSPTAGSQMRGITLIEQTDQSTAWEIVARQAEVDNQKRRAVAHDVRAQLFQDDAALMALEANRSIVQRDSGDINMQGNVRVNNEDGYTMTTETLDWHAKTRQLRTQETVEIEGPSVRITGAGLRSEVDEQRFHLEHNVHASFRLR